jgi:hypothetical protein
MTDRRSRAQRSRDFATDQKEQGHRVAQARNNEESKPRGQSQVKKVIRLRTEGRNA